MPRTPTSDEITPTLSQPRAGALSADAPDAGCAQISAVYERYRDELERHALTLVRSPDLAEEAVQQAFANTVSALREGVTISHPRRWLHRCVHNICLDRLREETLLPIDNALEVHDRELPAEAVELRERFRAVNDAVSNLPEHMRAAFVLWEVRGLAYSEIADEMGKSVNSVRMLLHRARKQVIEAVGRDTAMLAGPLLGLQGRYPFLAGQDRPRLRERLALRLDGLQAWLGSLGERTSQVALKPAIAIIAVLVASVPVLAPGGGQRPEGGAQDRRVGDVGQRSSDVRPRADARTRPGSRGQASDAPATRRDAGPPQDADTTPAPGSREPGAANDREPAELSAASGTSPRDGDEDTSGAGDRPSSPELPISDPFQGPPAPPPPDGSSGNETGGSDPGSGDGGSGVEAPGSGTGPAPPGVGMPPPDPSGAGRPPGHRPRGAPLGKPAGA